jgi:hypothetical protein
LYCTVCYLQLRRELSASACPGWMHTYNVQYTRKRKKHTTDHRSKRGRVVSSASPPHCFPASYDCILITCPSFAKSLCFSHSLSGLPAQIAQTVLICHLPLPPPHSVTSPSPPIQIPQAAKSLQTTQTTQTTQTSQTTQIALGGYEPQPLRSNIP